jgi:hypothetical protein
VEHLLRNPTNGRHRLERFNSAGVDLIAAFRAVDDLKLTPGTGQLSQLALFAASARGVSIRLPQNVTKRITKNLAAFIPLISADPLRRNPG